MERTYTVVLLHERDGRYSVSVPALPGCHTWGYDMAHALKMVEEAMQCHLAVLSKHGDPIPEDIEVFSVEMGEAREAFICRVPGTATVGQCRLPLAGCRPLTPNASP